MENDNTMKLVKSTDLWKTGWTGFAVRFAAALAYLVTSIIAQHYFDAAGSSLVVRCIALAVWFAGLALVITWLYRWLRRADEYQRMLMYRNLAGSMLVGLMVPSGLHIVHVFLGVTGDDWPIMAVPAFAITYTVFGSWPKKS